MKIILFLFLILILIQISLKLIPNGHNNNKTTLVQIMSWHRRGEKSLSEPMFPPIADADMRHSASISWRDLK